MKIFNNIIKSYLFLLLIKISLCINSKAKKNILNTILKFQTLLNQKKSQNLQDDETPKPLTFFTEESLLFQDYINATLEKDISAEPNCINYLISAYTSSLFPSVKLIRDSSHSLSKLGSYQDCKYKVYYDYYDESISSKNYSYNYILFYKSPDDVCKRPVLFSLCVPDISDCKKEDYAQILENFNMKTDFLDTSYIGEIEAYILDDNSKKPGEHFYIGLIVVFLCIILFVFEFFPCIPVFIFKCCFKKKFLSKSDKNLLRLSKKLDFYETASLVKLEESFDIKESFTDIYDKGIEVGYDIGISFIKGLRGIFLFLFILGNTLEAVYQYPLQKSYNQFFNTNSLSFLFFFNRCCKNVFLSLSSFTLCYKIICYFDNEVERNEMKNLNIKLDYINPEVINSSIQDESTPKKKVKSPKTRKRRSGGSPNSSSSNSHSNSSGSISNINNSKKTNMSSSSSFSGNNISTSTSGDLSKMPSMAKINSAIAKFKLYDNNLSIKSFLTFFFRQSYKFILFTIAVLFYRYFYYDFVSFTTECPMWEFIKNSYNNKLQSKYIYSLIFLYFPFYLEANVDIKYDLYDIIILEISSFIIFSIVIFFFYKKNYRLDIFLIILFAIGIALKIGAYLVIISPKINDKGNDIYDDYFYPSKGFTNKKWKLILNNPLYYFASISIGIFFGLVNYAIQKSAKNIKDFSNKIYLTIPIWFVNKLKKRLMLYTIIFSIAFIAYFIWCGLSYKILFLSDEKLLEDEIANDFFDSQSINIYYSFDVDIFVFLLFLAIIPWNLIGENFITSFLEHDYWNIFSRPYFSFMLLVQTIGCNILYRMNTNVDNSFKTIIFFAIINCISSIIFGMVVYILFEIPLKKVNRFIFTNKKENKDDNDNDKIKEHNHSNQDNKISEPDDKDEKEILPDL